jgi:TolA-binding protein
MKIKHIFAGILILGTIAALYFYFFGNKPSNEMIFEQNFSTFLGTNEASKSPIPINPVRTATTAIIPPAESTPAAIAKFMLDKGIRAYNNSDFTEAIHQFNSYINSGEAQPKEIGELRFYIGVATLAKGNTTEAEKIFADLANDSGRKHTFQEEAQWYLALTYLKADNISQAKKQLKKVAKIGHPYEEKAKHILTQI